MNRRGLTLVELVVALSVGTLVAGAALAALSSSFSAWARLAAGGTLAETHRALFLFERDAAAARPLPDEPLVGDTTSLTFPLEREGTLRVVSWDARDVLLVRREHPYRFGNEPPPSDDTLTQTFRLPSPADFTYPDGADSASASSPTNLPASVCVTIGDFSRRCPLRLAPP